MTTVFHPRRIFVPIAVGPNDDRPLAEALVDAACDLARLTDGALILVYAEPQVPSPVSLDIGFLPGQALETMYAIRNGNRALAQKALTAFEARVRAAGIEASSRIIEAPGSIGDAIAHAAVDMHADCAVVCSHGRRGMKRFLLGSTAERIAHLAPMPVLIVHAPPAPK